VLSLVNVSTTVVGELVNVTIVPIDASNRTLQLDESYVASVTFQPVNEQLNPVGPSVTVNASRQSDANGDVRFNAQSVAPVRVGYLTVAVTFISNATAIPLRNVSVFVDHGVFLVGVPSVPPSLCG
jgi:hypothetical protein